MDDYKDGVIGPVGTVQKTVATTLFLYFSVILPAVALGVLNDYNTKGAISVYQVSSSWFLIFSADQNFDIGKSMGLANLDALSVRHLSAPIIFWALFK